ncbi:hypothetical protein JOD64_000415 [Micromonospora luteifusca]|uniref:MFS transporter n=1 Tax=Micromonospora luteifusca TaxID=709860 RepID=A0ABS2LLX0_9ACTN|nr:hypothetical protein [Micromonospora luteifusca]MBM7489193.1 hypothetical protein [Micromonospora luteifusca]
MKLSRSQSTVKSRPDPGSRLRIVMFCTAAAFGYLLTRVDTRSATTLMP